VVFEEQKLTYRELNAKANQLAHHLQSLGVGPEGLVGICVERSLEMVVGLLGILKAGGAYMPLDPDYPKQRLAFMLEDAQAHCDSGKIRNAALPPGQSYLPRRRLGGNCPGGLITIAGTKADNLAYVIYTSGSGDAKGAMNTQAGVCNRLLWMQDAYN